MNQDPNSRRDFCAKKPGTIFKIYTSKQNQPATKVLAKKDWSFFPSESEILLMPMFCFQVVDIEKVDSEDLPNTTIITVIEIPRQNLLK